jgi:hypothetical protein
MKTASGYRLKAKLQVSGAFLARQTHPYFFGQEILYCLFLKNVILSHANPSLSWDFGALSCL